ncbi:MAG: YceI family protein [Myxococcota bacterium]|nr:YceI family protein [Myxococcota bacterium]
MHFELSSDSRVLIDLRAAGLLHLLAHDPTLAVRPEAMSFEVPGDTRDGALVDASFVARFRVDAIEPPRDLGPNDREKMIANMRGKEVLERERFPGIEFDARYVGSVTGGELSGHLVIRDSRRPIAMAVRVAPEGQRLLARAAWEGRLTALGIKPYEAFFGALKLDDWVRLRLEARFDVTPGG